MEYTRFKKILSSMLILIAYILNAEIISLNNLSDWHTGSSVSETDGILTVNGSTAFSSKKIFGIDILKSYKLKATVKGKGQMPIIFCFGFKLFNKQGKAIFQNNVCNIPDTDTTLVEPAQKGATKISVENAANWKTAPGNVIAYDTDPSLSDLPNFNIITIPVQKITKESTAWIIDLKTPLDISLPAGTKIRQHKGGSGYMYSGGNEQISNDWKTFSGTATGGLKSGFSGMKFAPGTAKVQIIMLVNWGNKNAISELKDISLEIE